MNGAEMIAAERERQVSEEGYSDENDDRQNSHGELLDAGICYALRATGEDYARQIDDTWPWDWAWWKPDHSHKIRPRDTDTLRCLVKAGALIAAEIDRLQRLAAPEGEGGANG